MDLLQVRPLSVNKMEALVYGHLSQLCIQKTVQNKMVAANLRNYNSEI